MELDFNYQFVPLLKPLSIKKIDESAPLERLKVDERLPQPCFLINSFAPRNSGKTNVLVNMLTRYDMYAGKFDIIFIWSKTFKYDSKWRQIKLPIEFVKEDFDIPYVHFIFDLIQKLYEQKPFHSLMIFDDMMDQNIMNPHHIGTLEAIAARGRHCNCSLIILSQMYMKTSSTVRNNGTDVICFRIVNADELEKFVHENREMLSVKKFKEMYHYATEEPHSFLYIKKSESNPLKRFRKNFDTLIQLQETSLEDGKRLNKRFFEHEDSETSTKRFKQEDHQISKKRVFDQEETVEENEQPKKRERRM